MRSLPALSLLLLFSLRLFAQNATFTRKIIDVDDNKFGTVLAKGDLNKDGVPDLISVTGGNLAVLLSTGPGSYNPTPQLYSMPPMLPGHSTRVIVGDFNGDGNLDVAGSDGKSVYVFLGNGDGTLRAPLTQANIVPEDAADFNNDGKLDVVSTFYSDGSWNSRVTAIYLGNGDGTFDPNPIPITAEGGQFRAGDFDGDGKMDLVGYFIGDFEGGFYVSMQIMYGDGAGHFETPSTGNSAGFLSGDIAIVTDVNKDGRSDIVGRYVEHPGYPRPDIPKTYVVYGSPTRQITEKTSPIGKFANLSLFPAGDFDNDSDLDLVLSDYQIQYRQSDDSYTTGTTFYGGSAYIGPIADDFTNDGKADILVPQIDSNGHVTQFELFTNSSAGTGCALPSSGVVVCNPVDGSTLQSPVRLRASAKLSGAVYRFEVWANNVKIYTGRDTSTIDAPVTLGPGDYTMTFVARTATGERAEKTIKFSVQATTSNCQAPASNGIVVCDPQPYSDVTSPFHVKALAKTGGTYRFELWAGSTKLVTVRDSGTMDTNVSLPKGTYLLHFVARRLDGTRYTKDLNVFVK